MEIDYAKMFFYFLKPAIIGVVIIIGITLAINLFKRFINGDMKIDEKPNDSEKVLEKDKNKSKIIGVAIIIDAIFGFMFPFSAMGAIVSPMVFDAPGSTEHFFNRVFFYTTFSFPVVILIAAITSLIFLFILKLYKIALVISLLPMLNIIILLLAILDTMIKN